MNGYEDKLKALIKTIRPGLANARDVFACKLKEDLRSVSAEAERMNERYGKKWIAGIVTAVLLLAVIICITVTRDGTSKAWLAGGTAQVPEYGIGIHTPADGSGIKGTAAVVTGSAVRGTAVKRFDESKVIDGVRYVKIKDDSALFRYLGATLPKGSVRTMHFPRFQYVREDSLSGSASDIVRETEVYARTPATIYEEENGPGIASFAPKGTCLKVIGFDRLDSGGAVNKYKVEYTGEDGQPAEGYVYGKYMTDTPESAILKYNGGGIHDKVKKDKYDMKLYGGKASHLDYYPYEKPVIEGNEFCRNARAMYLNCAAGTHPDKYIDIINETGCNAVVVDIKDGVLAYQSEVAKELSPGSYDTAYTSVEEYREGIEALRASGAYLIGRIVVFNDPIYADDHPENCIIWGENTGWPSPYSRDVWEYNVRLAQEAIREFGFNEIQFDYVRFPENSYEMSKSGTADFRNKYDEEKGQAVQNFLFYAADQIHEAGAYVSVDVFGESTYGYMTAYGQYWPAISNIVDAISAMPYTDHMGGDGTWRDPYGTMYSWARKAAKMQAYLENPAAARTWITGYDTPHWAPEVDYGAAELQAQINALYEQGLDGGFIPWNGICNIKKYREYKNIWNNN